MLHRIFVNKTVVLATLMYPLLCMMYANVLLSFDPGYFCYVQPIGSGEEQRHSWYDTHLQIAGAVFLHVLRGIDRADKRRLKREDNGINVFLRHVVRKQPHVQMATKVRTPDIHNLYNAFGNMSVRQTRSSKTGPAEHRK